MRVLIKVEKIGKNIFFIWFLLFCLFLFRLSIYVVNVDLYDKKGEKKI